MSDVKSSQEEEDPNKLPEEVLEQERPKKRRNLAGISFKEPNINTINALAVLEAEIKNQKISPEVALLLLIRKCRLDFDTLKSLAEIKLSYSFSQTRYKDIAPIFHLNGNAAGSDMLHLQIHRSRIPLDLLKEICDDLRQAELQYGSIEEHENEEARSRYITTLFNRLVCLFEKRIMNRPEKLLSSGVTSKGKIEYQYMSLNSVIIVFVEVKRELVAGSARLDQIAQVMAEADACDFFNDDRGHWVPIRGVLCDGLHFQFFEYDSSDSSWKQSQIIAGINFVAEDNEGFIGSIKRVCEFMYDLLLQGFLDSLVTFSNRSKEIPLNEPVTGRTRAATTVDTPHWKSPSTEKLRVAIEYAEKALQEARTGANMADRVRLRLKKRTSNKRSRQDTSMQEVGLESFEKAEELAILSLKHLRSSVKESPRIHPTPTFMDEWDPESYIGL